MSRAATPATGLALAEAAASGVSPPPLAPPADLDPALAAVRIPSPPPALVAEAAPAPPASWHARALQSARACENDPAAVLERRWHARWLAYHLSGCDPAHAPKISVVIPVYNRANQVVEAVASALSQDWPALEVIVADDGSDDDVAAALGRFDSRVVLCRLPRNRGVAAARNAALARATGEAVQFLDSDNLLVPGALAWKMAALAAVPDALLCISAVDRSSLPRVRDDLKGAPLGSPLCPTRRPAAGLIHRFPFPTSAALVARHQLIRAGAFDERLRQHEDRLLFQQLGLLETRCIAVDAPLTLLRRAPGSLSQAPDPEGLAALAALIFLNALLRSGRHWDLAALVLQQCFWRDQWETANRRNGATLAAEVARLIAWLDDFAEGRALPELSPRPLAAELSAMLDAHDALAPEGAHARGSIGTPLNEALARLRRARPPGAADLALWRGSHNPAQNQPAFLEIFAELSDELRRGRPWVPLTTLDGRPFRSLPHGRRRHWKRLAQAARLLGEGPALRLARWLG